MIAPRTAPWAAGLLLAALVACNAEEELFIHGPARNQQIRPTDGTGWMGNGYGSVKVEKWDPPSGKMRIHYTRVGKHAVPATDADKNGVPDFVEQFGKTFDEVYKAEVTQLGFRPPLDDSKYHDRPDYGGDSRFDVYLQDQGAGADGYIVKEACKQGLPLQCAGYMVVENDFVGFSYPTPQDGMKVLASHEFFHIIQNAYRTNMASTFSEATAVWATERIYPKQDDFERFARHFFPNAHRSLDHKLGGPSDVYPYALGVWIVYLAQQFGDKALLAIFDELSEKGTSSNDLDAIDKVLARDHSSSLAKAFAEFALWNFFTGKRAKDFSGYKGAADFYSVKITSFNKTLPFRISGEIAYLAANYYKVVAPKDRWIKVTTERAAAKLALHLVTFGVDGKPTVASIGPDKTSLQIRSTGEVYIVAASTARKDRHLPLSLAITETSGPKPPQPDSGVPSADAGPGDTGSDDGGCAVAGSAPASVLAALVLLLSVWARRRFGRALLTAAPLCALLLAGCPDDPDPGSDGPLADATPDGAGGAEAGGDATPKADAAGSLAVGQFKDFPADSAGKIEGSTPVTGKEKFLLLLTSQDTRALKSHAYSTSLPAGGSSKSAAPPPAGHDPQIHRCTFARRLRGIMDSRPPSLREEQPYAYSTVPPKKGDKRTFKISSSGTSFTTITAEAIHVDGTAAFWLDKTTTPLASIEAADIKAVADGFSKIIVPRERIYFGQESDVDGDKLISVLFSPLVAGSAIAYFSPCDLLDPAVVTYCKASNKMELLYVSPPSSLKPPYNTVNAMLEVVAHELQHAIYFNRKYLLNNKTGGGENPYVTEGLSHLAQDLSGYQAGNLYVVLATLKGIDLVAVPNLGSDAISTYIKGPSDGVMRGADYLLLRYLFDRAGGDAMDSAGKPLDKGGIKWLRTFMDAKETGLKNLTGSTKLELSKLSLDFWTAMAVSNRGVGGKPISSEARYNFLPTTVDPLTKRQRGCNLFAAFHGSKMNGPATQSFTAPDKILRAGGGELLLLAPKAGQPVLRFSVTADSEAKAQVRLIRVE